MLIPFDHQGSITNLANDINRARYQYFADVINCSWRTLAEDPSDPTKYINYSFPVIEEAIENAIQAGIVVVASAGNPPDQWNGLDPSEYPPYTLYPAAYTGVIAVSATNSSDNFPNGYNYGSHVDVSAPSISILTTNTNNSYGTYNGTSFGSPLTAALAGLCLSINPDLNNSDVEAIIENNSEDLGTTGWDDYFGEGRIDAFEALKHTPTWNNVIKNNMYGYNGGSIKYQSTSYTSPYTIPEYFWKQNVQAVNQSYGGIDYAFSHWNDGIKNPYRELELENDGNYTAVYTGHLYSTSTTATATGGSRKVWSNSAWDPNNSWDPNNPGNWVVYEDNGDIYYTEYRVDHISGQYFYWKDEELISDGSGNSKYPSIAIAGGGYGYTASDREYCIVWQQYNPATSKYKIVYREFNTSNGDPQIITDQSTSDISRPVVSVTSGTMGFNYGYYWHFVWDNGNGLKFSDGYTIENIPNTNSNSHNPTITNDPILYAGQIAMAWEQSGDIYFQQIDFMGSPSEYPVENITSSYSNLNTCQQPSIAMDGEIMLTWQGRTGHYDEKILGKNTEAIPPPASMRYNPIFARRKSVSESESEWGTLKEIMYSNYSQSTPSVGSCGDDFSVIWKVNNQNKIAKLDYIDGEGWNLDSEIEIFTSTGSSNPSISTASWAISAVWSENSSPPFKIHHEQLENPAKNKQTKGDNYRIYRKADLDLEKIDSNISGNISILMGEIEDENNTPLIRFIPDSLTSGSHMSSPFFIVNSSHSKTKVKLALYGDNIDISKPGINPNLELFRLVLKSDKNGSLRNIKKFRIKDIQIDTSGVFYVYEDLLLNINGLRGKNIRIDVVFRNYSGEKYIPMYSEIFHLDANGTGNKSDLIENIDFNIENNTSVVVEEYALHPAYPNPFNPVTTITFDIPEQSSISLKVFDVQGKIVAELFNGRKDVGRYTAKFDGSGLSSGVYFYEMTGNPTSGKGESFRNVKKMMLVK